MAEDSRDNKARLEGAYRDLDYLQPLMPDDRRLARELFEGALQALARELLLLRGEPRKVLLHGHLGCGKSTFLNCLQAHPELQEHFLVVPVDIQEISDPDDVDVVDMLLAAFTAALDSATTAGVDLPASAVPDVVELYQELRGLVNVEAIHEEARGGELKVEGGLSIPAILSWLRAGFQVNYRGSVENRRKVRRTFAPRIGNLIERTNTTISAIEANLGADRRLLFLVHDTDKPALTRALHLFDDQGYQLSQIRAAAVIVVDKALACSGRFSVITTRLGAARPFPAFKIFETDGSDSGRTRQNRQLLKQVLVLRLPADLIEPSALDWIIEQGGGHLRETLRIAREAVLRALLRDSFTVNMGDAEYAVIQRRNEFNLTRQQWKVLREVLANPFWCPESEDETVQRPESPFLSLLNGIAMLEYTNAEEKWLRPHPVLIPRARRQA